MQLDEEGTYARVMRQRRELIEPTLAEHHGKLINYAGDGFLAMFDSPVEAVRCAIVIHQSMVARNASLPREQWILYRIGVHLGDVIVEPDGVFGDGVNIAARLEGIATPGDLFISGGVYEQIKNKLVCAYQSLGDRQVKNITDPVTVYRVLPDPAALSQARRHRWPVALLAVLIIGVIAILGGWYLLLLQKQIANQAPKLAGTSQTPGAPGETAKNPQPGPAPLRLGSKDFGSFLEGGLSRVRLWNRVLTAAEVSDLYTADTTPRNGLVAEFLLNADTGTTALDSAQGNDGTIFNAVWARE